MRNKKTVLHTGQRLTTLTGTAEVTTASGALKTKNVWQDHGTFPSRSMAQEYAKSKYPGRKYHIAGVRVDVTPLEAPTRRSNHESTGTDTLVAKAQS